LLFLDALKRFSQGSWQKSVATLGDVREAIAAARMDKKEQRVDAPSLW
jgi:hypothetical protein